MLSLIHIFLKLSYKKLVYAFAALQKQPALIFFRIQGLRHMSVFGENRFLHGIKQAHKKGVSAGRKACAYQFDDTVNFQCLPDSVIVGCIIRGEKIVVICCPYIFNSQFFLNNI